MRSYPQYSWHGIWREIWNVQEKGELQSPGEAVAWGRLTGGAGVGVDAGELVDLVV